MQTQIKISESQIQSTICNYLAYKGYFFWRQNNVATIQIDSYGTRMRRMPKYARKGTPDIFILLPGKVIFMEVKSSIGQLSQEQKELQKKCEEFQIQYCVVRSLEDVQKLGF